MIGNKSGHTSVCTAFALLFVGYARHPFTHKAEAVFLCLCLNVKHRQKHIQKRLLILGYYYVIIRILLGYYLVINPTESQQNRTKTII